MSARPHCQVGDKLENYIITVITSFRSDNCSYIILQFATHCQQVTFSVKIFQHLTKHIDISVSDIRNVCLDVYQLLYTELGKEAIVRQWNSETAGC
jgi:hypothetical protein